VLLVLTSTSNTVARLVLRFKSGGPHDRTEFGMRLSGAHGYDERFRRLWVFYLTLSEVGFREGRIGDVQALPAKPQYSATP